MVDKIIDKINSKLVNLVEKSYGLSEIIEGESSSFPAIYDMGEWKYVTDFDMYFAGLSYIRKNGTTKHSYPELLVSPNKFVQLNIPLKLVLFIPKKNLNNDDNYSNDRAAYEVIKLIGTKTAYAEGTNASRISILTIEHDTNSNSVLNGEYKGEIKGIDPKFCYLSIDFEIEILIKKECINECCL